jgi:transposase-like protein
MTREFWKGHVEALAASGLTAAAYAAQAGVHPGTLAAWRSKLRSPKPSTKKQVRFIEVQAPATPATPVTPPEAGVIELVVGGARILIRGRVEADALTPVLAALEDRR